MPKTADLLEEIAALKAMLVAADARDRRSDERIERLEKLVAAFKQAVFGRKSEKSDPDQFELALEDLETAMAVIHAEEDAEDRAAKRPAKPRTANRGSLPKHLPRIEEIIEPDSLTCACGGCPHSIGEDVSELPPAKGRFRGKLQPQPVQLDGLTSASPARKTRGPPWRGPKRQVRARNCSSIGPPIGNSAGIGSVFDSAVSPMRRFHF